MSCRDRMDKMEKESVNRLERWFDLNKKSIENFTGKEQQILQINIDLKQQSEAHDFYSLVITNMKDFGQMTFDNPRKFNRLLRIVITFSELVQAMSSTADYVNSFKTYMSMLKTNRDFVGRENLLAFPISSICKSLVDNFKSDQNWNASIHIKLITELQKLFGSQFHGTSHIVEAFVDLQCLASESAFNEKLLELLAKLKNLLWTELNSPHFYVNFFSQFNETTEAKLQIVFELCVEIIDRVMESKSFTNAALPSDSTSNFFLQIINFIAKNPQTIQTQPTNFTQIVQKLSQFLSSDNISEESFQFLEQELIQAMLTSDDFWTSQLSFYVFQEFLGEMESTDLIAHYFVLFQNLLKHIWNSSTNISTRRQIYFSNIVRFMIRRHPMAAQENIIDEDLAEILMEVSSPDCQLRFTEAFDSLIDNPTVENYYEMMRILTLLSFSDIELEQKTVEKLAALITMTDTCDWVVNAALIIKIMRVMIATENNQHKLIFLLKLNPALSIDKTKPFELKHKLLELLFSFLQLSELKQGIPGLVTRELKRLCEGNNGIICRRIQSYFTEGESIPWNIIESVNMVNQDFFSEEESHLEILRNRAKLVHKCPEISHAEVSEILQHSERLQLIFSYFKSLEDEELTEQDLKVIQEISENLQDR